MRPVFRKNLFLSFLFVIAFFAVLLFWEVFAQWTETWYTDFYVVWWVDWKANLSTTWHDWDFQFVLSNYSTDIINWNIYFVDAVELSSWVYACLSNDETSEFGQYLSWDQEFHLNSNETYTWTVSYSFPDNYSWVYYGCIIYASKTWDSVINMTSRKAYFLNIVLSAKNLDITMIANLWSRWNATTSNNNWYESKWKMLFYALWNHTEPLYQWYVIMNASGVWVLSWQQIMAGCYDIVYKWWHHLSSYITNFCIHEWEIVDFVNNSNLFWVWSFDSSLSYNWWVSYQIAWDMPTSNKVYDNVINWTDLSVLYSTELCPYSQSVSHYNVCDLNNDGRVNSTDASVILSNLQKKDTAFYSGLFQWFGTVNYFD